MAHVSKIFGPPGTGKTRKLMSLVEKEVRHGLPLTRIAYVSFTKGAAEVIRDRMKAAEADVKWFRTIHSAAMANLGIGRDAVISSPDYRRFRELTGMEIRGDEYDDWDDEKPLDFTPTKRAYEMSLATGRDIAQVIREMPPHVNLTRGRVDMFIDKWTRFKRDVSKFDFSDMLTRYASEGTPLPVDAFLLDEAQDLSDLQWRCFEIMSRDAKRVYMAGDDDQAIYPFIGGSEYGFLDYPCDEEQVLSKSYRVPRAIGAQADRIISRVGHRKAKAVEWRDDPGDVQRMNLDAFTLPWRSLVLKYKDIMVLTRHRKGARNFSDDLKAVGVPHEINGEGLASWSEAKIVQAFYVLRDGGKVTSRQASKLLEELDLPADALKGMKARAMVTRAMLPNVDFDARTWVQMFAGDNRVKQRRYEAIRQLINNEGVASLAKKPSVRVSTMHAAKGAEAELVIIVPECTSIVRRNMMTPAEIRLAYVAMTRAKRQTYVLIPRSDSYIIHFFGG